MALRPDASGSEAARRREKAMLAAERRLEQATDAAIRRFLRRVHKRTRPAALTAAGSVPRPYTLMSLGEAQGWWEEILESDVVDAVADVWRTGYFDTRDGDLLRSSQGAIGEYLGNVTDRLSRTATPTIPEHAFDTARLALADEMARGSSIRETSRRLAAEFSWDEDATFWRERLAETDATIDRALDAIGAPGDPGREMARLNDPDIAALQARRSEAVSHIDAVESTWQTRAERIARTETTGAYNAGSIDAAVVEDAGVKVWIATADDRTREEHLEASGQCVEVLEAFEVGGVALDMPGSPSGPPELTINCRCTMVFADDCGEAAAIYGDVDDVIDVERERRGVDAPEPAPEPVVEPEPAAAPPEPAPEPFTPVSDPDRAGDRWARDVWGATDWDASERRAMETYQGSAYRHINRELRFAGDPGQVDPYVRGLSTELDNAIAKAPPLPENMEVYRGLEGDFAAEIRNGLSEWTDRGFSSTSINPGVAQDFAADSADAIILAIRAPAGTKATYMNANPQALTSMTAEREMLFQRGTRFRVVERDARQVTVEIVDQAAEHLPPVEPGAGTRTTPKPLFGG